MSSLINIHLYIYIYFKCDIYIGTSVCTKLEIKNTRSGYKTSARITT